MDEDAPSFTIVLIINILIYIVIPLVLAYRRGYFFNFGEHCISIKNLFMRNKQYLPINWTVTRVRHLSAFEKQQVRKIVVKYIPGLGYRVIIILKSNKTLYYPIGKTDGYRFNDEINKESILIRTWQKDKHYTYDIIPILNHE